MIIKSLKRIQKLLGARDESKQAQMSSKIRELYGNNNLFIGRDGKIKNKNIDYRRILNSPNVSDRAKELINAATGIMTDNQYKNAQNAGTKLQEVSPEMSSGVQKNKTDMGEQNAIVASAQKFLGTPYVWGGESMSEGGMDCSGFVYNALKDAGYNVGRTTAQGYRGYGTQVSKGDMKPGDIVFFGKGNASHVGIYIGDGKMIHSSGGKSNTKSNPGKGVSITNVNYRSDFLEARRY